MIWLIAIIIGAGYAWYCIDKFVDNINPHNFDKK